MPQKRVRASGSTTYVARWYTPDGKQLTRGGFRTRKAAKAFEDEARAALAAGTAFDPGKGKMLFRDAAAIWLESRKADTRNNAENHRYALTPAARRRGDGKTLGIDAVFGGYPLNKITREYIQEWVNRLTAAGKKPSTVRHAFFTVRMILEQAVADGRLSTNPAQHVKYPAERAKARHGAVDDRTQFLTAQQVSALVAATPAPYNVLVHLAAWTGLRAAELAGLQVGDVQIGHGPNILRVLRAARGDGQLKTAGSIRTVPLTPATVEMLRDYLATHPRAADPTAPLFPAFKLSTPRPTGVRATPADTGAAKPGVKDATPSAEAKARARRQAEALAELSVAEAEARLVLDWAQPYNHPALYKSVFRPAVLRAHGLAKAGDPILPPALKFHALRHTYASLSVAAGIKPERLSGRMGHANVRTTLDVYVHLLPEDDASADMAALGALATLTPTYSGNVVPLHG